MTDSVQKQQLKHIIKSLIKEERIIGDVRYYLDDLKNRYVQEIMLLDILIDYYQERKDLKSAGILINMRKDSEKNKYKVSTL